MAITDKEKGVWGIDKVFAKQNQGSIWEYSPFRQLWMCGRNGYGGLGQNQNEDSGTPGSSGFSSPVQVPGTTWVAGTTNTYYGASVIKSDGTLWCWGYNGYGNLGLNNNTSYSSPVQVPGTNWANISSHNNSEAGVLATKTDGTLWAWGYNGQGALGQSNKTQYSSPIQIPGTTWSTSAESFSINYYMSMAIKTDGTLWTWGASGNGRLGLSSQQSFSSPKQVPGTTWSKVGKTTDGFMAIKTDGTLWTCGSNPFGEMGIGSRTPYSSPKQVPGTTWKSISGCGSGAVAVKTDGTLWSWGRNIDGRLGHNDVHAPGPESKTTPQQVGSDTNWDTVCTTGASFATKTDGTMWAWGNNDEGHLNNNNRIKRSSPTQIPGTNWKSLERIGATGDTTILIKEA
tara:strand:+ start:146 stop:1342 length:1197 start_codon:yes stop_codon:yes gene_type:complete